MRSIPTPRGTGRNPIFLALTLCATVASISTGVRALGADDRIGTVRLAGSGDFDCDSIKHDGQGAQPWTWLSVPASRIVLNPYPSVVNGTARPLTGDLPLHLAYFVGRRAVRLDEVVTVHLQWGGSIGLTRAAWYPHQLQQTAECRSADLTIEATDFFADENTVLRTLQFRGGSRTPPDTAPVLDGNITGRVVAGDDPSVLLVGDDDFFHAIAIADMSGAGRATALLPGIKHDARRWWVTIPALRSGGRKVAVAVALATKLEGAVVAVARARDALLKRPAAELLAARKHAWDALLAKVPAPERFGITAVDARAVTPELHRQWYYGAWAFVLSSVVPPLPENNYTYYAFAEGKPSCWVNGERSSPAQCAWTSFMLNGLLSGMFPEWAWSSYEGIMARITPQGELSGESLPSRKAQGAWMLYSVTGDAGRLRKIYPALRRYLIWREQNPRWILERGSDGSSHDFPDEKDAEFVVSHLIDLDFAGQIAAALKMNDEVEFWRRMSTRELAHYREWFFPAGGEPAQYYFANTGANTFMDRTEQGPLYIATGLAYRALPDDLAAKLRAYYLKIHDPKKPLVGFEFMKYGDSSFIAYGLIERGMQREAAEFMDALMRDNILAGDFAEEQRFKGGRLIIGGVMPTLFLPLQMIDFTLMRNGVRLDRGRPEAVPGFSPHR